MFAAPPGVARLEGKRSQPDQSGPVWTGPLEERPRLVGAALTGAELTQSRKAVGCHAWPHGLQVGESGEQLGLGGGPLAPAGQDVSVGAAADVYQVAAVETLADRPHRFAPLRHAAEVANTFADRDHDAQRPRRRDGELEVLTGGDRRGLVKAAHALIDATVRNERGALDGDSERLEVCDPELRSQSRGLAAAAHRDLEVCVDFECVVALDDQQPPVLGAGRVPREQGPGPLDPAGGYRRVAPEMQEVVGEPACDSRCAMHVARAAIRAERLLARG
jgi:hypothetical protein